MNRFDFTGKTILVTGATRGIGRAIAEAFVHSGATVYGTGRSDFSVSSMESSGIKGRVADVTEGNPIAAIIDEICSQHDRLDCLINNAGISSNTPAAAFKDEEMDQIIDTNFKGVFKASQAYYQKQRKSGGGIIINLASILGMVGYPLASVYSGTKGAVIQLTRALAIEWAGAGFRINTICPGFVETDMTSGLRKRPAVLEQALANIPLKRLGQPEDISGAALFLASEASAYMTGQTLVIDGGITAQ